MTMSTALARCLSKTQSRFETVHRHGCPDGTAPARPISIPGGRLARTVLLEDSSGLSRRRDPRHPSPETLEICEQTGRQLARARAGRTRGVPGLRPRRAAPVGMAYGTADLARLTACDPSRRLFRSRGPRGRGAHRLEQFATLMAGARRGHFAHRRL